MFYQQKSYSRPDNLKKHNSSQETKKGLEKYYPCWILVPS